MLGGTQPEKSFELGMNQDWFEMRAIRRRKLGSAVWIPLRASQRIEKVGKYGYIGFKEEFFGAGTLAVSVENREEASQLGWRGLGIRHDHAPYVQDGLYVPADHYHFGSDAVGINLVLEQRGNSLENRIWHLHPDLILGLRLVREGDVWLSMEEGYDIVVRLCRDEDGNPSLLEMRAEHLRDFLCAREMALYSTSYRQRQIVTDDASVVDWQDGHAEEVDETSRWEGRVIEIHEGGFRFGEEWAVFHSSRTDVDPEEDVPLMPFPTDDNVETDSWTAKRSGRKLFVIEGEVWRNEWVEPGSYSPRIRMDERPSTVYFIVDAEGNRERADMLAEGGRWLWFKPDVIMALAHRRGGSLSWYTRDTGSVSCSPDFDVHFGVNELSLINVYAKDVALLPEWQQQVWSGHNVGPDGGVSSELLASQVRAQPADTQAPEPFLASGLELLNELSGQRLGFQLIRTHVQVPEILERTHRFRAIDRNGLFALAKDVARLTADSIDAAAIHDFLSLPKKDRPGSLKSLERLLATKAGSSKARLFMGPLVGAYEMRHGDAHLPSSKIDDSLRLVRVDPDSPLIIQGRQLLHWCATSIWRIIEVLKNWDQERSEVTDEDSSPSAA